METQRWQDWVTTLAGAWILLTPWLVGTMTSGTLEPLAFWTQIGIGLIVLALGLGAIFAYRAWEEWIEVVLGLATIAMPWVLGYSVMTVFTVSNVIAGLVVVVMSGWMVLGDPERAA